MNSNKEKLLSLKEISKKSPYSSDYLSLLVRKKKLKGVKKEGKWMTTEKNLEDYLEKVAQSNYKYQESLNVKIPAIESKKALVNLKWGILLVIIFSVSFLFLRLDANSSEKSDVRVEKDQNNNLTIYLDDPNSVGEVTIISNDSSK